MSSREFLNKSRHGALPHPDPFITSNSQEVSIIKISMTPQAVAGWEGPLTVKLGRHS